MRSILTGLVFVALTVVAAHGQVGIRKPDASMATPLAEKLAPPPVASKTPTPGAVFKDCATCPEMVVIPPGKFIMGSPATEASREPDEGQHEVTIAKAFAVGKFHVTFADWDACVADGGCGGYSPDDKGYGRGNRPVINVSWNDAQTYLRWLSGKTRKQYRLLTEAEWEYAARAKTKTTYWWGPTISRNHANYGTDGCCGYMKSGNDKWLYTSPVDSFPPNPFGLYDMAGNVYQLVADCGTENYSNTPVDGSPSLTGDCDLRGRRGAGWFNSGRYLRHAFRQRTHRLNRNPDMGFRVARSF